MIVTAPWQLRFGPQAFSLFVEELFNSRQKPI